MTEIFNKYGAMSNKDVEKASAQIYHISSDLFEELHKNDGHSLSEIRSYSFYLILAIIEAKKKYYWKGELDEEFFGMIGNDKVKHGCLNIFNLTKELLVDLNVGHFNANGVSAYLVSSVDVALGQFILFEAMKIRKAEKNENKSSDSICSKTE